MSRTDFYSPSAIRHIGAKHGFRNSKSLGQNFLTDRGVTEEIVDASDIGPEDLVIEIGPGFGTLTAAAAKRAGRVAAVEIDRQLIPILETTLGTYDNIEIINRDILKTDISDVIDETKKDFPWIRDVKVIGNLPYYITTPIIMKLLEGGAPCSLITVMMQKEVADRICSPPGKKTYGALSIAVQYYCEVTRVCDVPKEMFTPVPKVDSAVLRLDVRTEKPVELLNEELFFVCVKAGFSRRRKTLLNCLTGLRGMEKDEVREVLENAGIDPVRRAETLTIDEFARIANDVERGSVR
ncbi:MAG: 16S rRNA (adenine(1518)-N(6)/adenine(1519)-N(6))-dimethyltransferase RsmA [Anaerovoracaceae bacterium]|nr:16S rRNA (adenine(1518)-N(6)/adenine(1519)-N(6))-dimethyltransferase RsmA [Anaerovoracaceae bacterium]